MKSSACGVFQCWVPVNTPACSCRQGWEKRDCCGICLTIGWCEFLLSPAQSRYSSGSCNGSFSDLVPTAEWLDLVDSWRGAFPLCWNFHPSSNKAGFSKFRTDSATWYSQVWLMVWEIVWIQGPQCSSLKKNKTVALLVSLPPVAKIHCQSSMFLELL